MPTRKSSVKNPAPSSPEIRKAVYGWLPDIPDTRDHLYGAVRKIPAKLPAKVDLRPTCSPVENQKELGSCTANALAGALEFLMMRACLADGYPLVFGFSVYEGFESQKVAKTGVVDMPKAGEKMLGGHAVLAVGYDDDAKRFTVRNSWGADWGKKGYFTMPYDYVADRNLSDDFWTIRRGENM